MWFVYIAVENKTKFKTKIIFSYNNFKALPPSQNEIIKFFELEFFKTVFAK